MCSVSGRETPSSGKACGKPAGRAGSAESREAIKGKGSVIRRLPEPTLPHSSPCSTRLQAQSLLSSLFMEAGL